VIVFRRIFAVLPAFQLAGQGQPPASGQVRPQVAGRPIRDGQVTTVYLAPRYVTAVRMPEPVNSAVVGDSGAAC
jgi:type IV secretory pathway VirB9-like protein